MMGKLAIFSKAFCLKKNRYEVSLPLKRDWKKLNNKSKNQFKGLTSRMKSDNNLFPQYREIQEDYISK